MTGAGYGTIASKINGGINGTAGAGTLTMNGTGAWTLSGTNTYTGGTSVNAGTLLVTNGSGLGTGAVTVTAPAAGAGLVYLAPGGTTQLALGSTLILDGTSGTTIIGDSIGSSTAGNEIVAAGTASATGAIQVNVYGTGVTPTNGTYTLVGGAAGSTLNGGSSYTLKVYNNTNFTVGALAESATAITLPITNQTAIGTAFWKGGLSGATNVWAASDGSSVSNWTTTAGGAVQALIPGSGANVTISATSPTTVPTSTVLGANMTINSLTINDTNGLGLNADGNTLSIKSGITMGNTAGTSAIAANLFLVNAQNFTNNSANALTISGAVNGNYNNGGTVLTINGSGTVVLAGANLYAGGTSVTAGTLSLTGSIENGYTVAISGTGIISESSTGTITNAPSNFLTFSSSGTSTLAGVNAIGNGSGSSSISAGTVNLSGSLTTSTMTVSGGTLNLTGLLNASATTSGAGVISESSTGSINGVGSNLTIGGTGTSTLAGVNVIGTTNNQFGSSLTGGTLNLSGSLTTDHINISGGTLSLSGSLSGNNVTTSGAGIISESSTGSINGGGNIVTIGGAGTTTLAGPNTYGGGTTVSAGTLVAGISNATTVSGAFGPSADGVTLGNAATTTNNSAVALLNAGFTVSNPITVSANSTAGGYTIGGSNTTGTANYTGNITLNQAVTLVAATGGTTDFNTGTWTTNNKAFTIGSSGNTGTVQVDNVIGGSSTITVNNGTLKLTGPNTYSGGTTVSAGTLIAGVSNATTVSGAFGPSVDGVTLGNASTANAAVALLNAGFTVSNPITVSANSTAGGYTIGGSNTTGTANYTGNIALNQGGDPRRSDRRYDRLRYRHMDAQQQRLHRRFERQDRHGPSG